MAMNGIDIASYQAGIDLSVVPCDFVIVKATEGTGYVNPDFIRAYAQAKNAGKCLGIYHYANGGDYQKEADYFAVKMPVFSFEKIRGADISLGPEMKSTGECLGIAKTFNEALYKAFEGAGIRLPKYKKMIMTIRENEQEEAVDIARRFANVGYQIFATRGTARTLNEHGVKALEIRKLEQESPNILDLVLGHQIDLIIDIPAQGAERSHDGFVIRRNAIETGVYVLTALDTARALVTSLENRAKELTLVDIATVKNA